MYVMTITDEYDGFINCADNENENFEIIPKYFFLAIPRTVLLLSLIGLFIWTKIKPSKNG